MIFYKALSISDLSAQTAFLWTVPHYKASKERYVNLSEVHLPWTKKTRWDIRTEPVSGIHAIEVGKNIPVDGLVLSCTFSSVFLCLHLEVVCSKKNIMSLSHRNIGSVNLGQIFAIQQRYWKLRSWVLTSKE